MARPKSPPLAFESSPAMLQTEPSKENHRFNTLPRLNSTTSEPVLPNDRRQSKEVRFSPMTSPTARSQSMISDLPLLEKIPSASELPNSHRASSISASTDFTAYIEQSRALLQSQRAAFERERTGWAEERKLWDTERMMMQARIADLEFTINKSGLRKSSTDATFLPSQPLVAEHGSPIGYSNGHDSRRTSSSGSGHQVWEGSGAGIVATRVFSNEERKKAEERLPTIAENELPNKSLPLNTNPAERQGSSFGIPIENIDSKLDGITLKASALPLAFVATVISPGTPSPTVSPRSDAKPSQSLNLEVLGEIPLEEASNLTKHAGHTPMGIKLTDQGPLNAQTPGENDVQTPTQERPYAPQPSVRPPSEKSETYFPAPDDDPELAGPLALGQKEDSEDSRFLHVLDEKLEQEARKVFYEPSESDISDDQDSQIKDDEDDGEPRLKLKHSTNFGSAFGAKDCGNV